MKKTLTFIGIYILILYFVYINHREILEWITESDPSLLPLMFLFSTLFGVIPVIPFSVFAGMMGSKYGLIIGASINWFGTVAASVIIYLLARYGFSEYFTNYLKRFRGITKFNELIRRNAFMAILFTRLIPIVPPPVVNVYSGLIKINLVTYTVATIVGKLPGMILYAFVGDRLFSSLQDLLYGLVYYILFLLLILIVYFFWNKTNKN
jgi:uncharacterized membrane protein YdjX (TVP38/TMEM64 family)